jgi:predicted O-methyltransferase YrrM
VSREDYRFSNDWFGHNIDLWNKTLGDLKSQENHILEIGSFEGASTTWFLDELANHPDSTATAIDAFDTVLTLKQSEEDTMPMSQLELRFRENVAKSPNAEKLRVKRGLSRYVLRSMANEYDSHFNLVYVDGSHRARDVSDDAMLAWPMLQDDGYMIFDDYRWRKYAAEYDNPKLAIDSFLGTHATELTVVHRDFQVIVNKHPRIAEAVRHTGSFIRDLDEAA